MLNNNLTEAMQEATKQLQEDFGEVLWDALDKILQQGENPSFALTIVKDWIDEQNLSDAVKKDAAINHIDAAIKTLQSIKR